MAKKQSNPPASGTKPAPPASPSPRSTELTINAREMLSSLSSVLLARTEIMSRLGKSFGTQRDLYQALGFIINPTFNDYWWRYRRTAFGRRVVRAYPVACWKRPPQIQENEDPDETTFEKAWAALAARLRIFRTLRRLDILSGIGKYGILYMGFTGKADEPLRRNEKLLYLKPLTESAATVEKLEENPRNPRYGLPLEYKITLTSPSGGVTSDLMIHYTRVLHVAEDIADGEIEGVPRLEAPLNDLQSLDLVVGGSGEMFWRGALPGTVVSAKDGVAFPAAGTTDAAALDDQINDFVHNLRRYMKLEGAELNQLAPQVASPKDHFEVLVAAISAATGIPVRILLGSERGELASTQDRENWGDAVLDRQTNFCEPEILRPLIDKLIWVGELPSPVTLYTVKWPPIQAASGKETSETAKAVAEALNAFASGAAETVVPRSTFLRRYLNFTPAEIADMEDELADIPEPEPEQPPTETPGETV